MDATIKARWVEALRSEKYRQWRCKLRAGEDCFCVLGLLCEIVAPEKWARDEHRWVLIHENGKFHEYFVSDEIAKKAGLTDAKCSEIMRLNDQEGKSFAELAAWVEENL